MSAPLDLHFNSNLLFIIVFIRNTHTHTDSRIDSHVPKSIRALAHHDAHFGAIPPGGFIGAFTLADPQKESFPGSSKLDGSIFLRGAGVVLGVKGWSREGEKEGGWDRSALGYDEAWKG
jgi:pre-mRNA-splicing factor ATP-dependent RNA helicase DHX16